MAIMTEKYPQTEDLDGDGVFDTTSDPGTTEDLDGDGSFDNVHEDVNNNKTWENTGDKGLPSISIKTNRNQGLATTPHFSRLWGDVPPKAVDLEQVQFLWSAIDWLSDYPVDKRRHFVTESNRSAHISTERKRYIFTWNDLDNDGTVDYSGNEVKELVESSTDWNSLAKDFDAADGYRGEKNHQLASRQGLAHLMRTLRR